MPAILGCLNQLRRRGGLRVIMTLGVGLLMFKGFMQPVYAQGGQPPKEGDVVYCTYYPSGGKPVEGVPYEITRMDNGVRLGKKGWEYSTDECLEKEYRSSQGLPFVDCPRIPAGWSIWSPGDCRSTLPSPSFESPAEQPQDLEAPPPHLESPSSVGGTAQTGRQIEQQETSEQGVVESQTRESGATRQEGEGGGRGRNFWTDVFPRLCGGGILFGGLAAIFGLLRSLAKSAEGGSGSGSSPSCSPKGGGNFSGERVPRYVTLGDEFADAPGLKSLLKGMGIETKERVFVDRNGRLYTGNTDFGGPSCIRDVESLDVRLTQRAGDIAVTQQEGRWGRVSRIHKKGPDGLFGTAVREVRTRDGLLGRSLIREGREERSGPDGTRRRWFKEEFWE